MAIVWNKDIETGNAIIDAEHKELIAHINALMEACSVGKGRASVNECADFLLNYTLTHFAHEEDLQRKSKFPNYDMHKKWHDEFTKTGKGIIANLKASGPTIGSVAEVNKAASTLIIHIKSMDVALAKHIKDASI